MRAMTDTVRFVLNGRAEALRDVDPTMTVLTYLRTVAFKRGTKEGCAEGDCGACTVVLGELEHGHVRYRAVNSCILFVPTLHGKQLVTVEDLKAADGSLHPVQRSMVECNSSQCGFCTPGFVMSLFALHQSARQPPSRRQIDDCLAGNLCRCTGYRPIVAAARRMYALPSREAFTQRHRGATALLEAIRPSGTLVLRRGERTYFAPASLADLSELYIEHPNASLLAGGTDVGLWVTKGHRDLNTIIYVGNVRELTEVRVTDSHLEIGAAVTYTDGLPAIAPHYPPFAELIRRLGSTQIRNSATMGGNIANGSPIGDSMPALIALGSSLVLRAGMVTREISLDEFYLDYRKTALAPGEFVERIRIPIHGARRRFATYKISKRFDQDISSVCGAYCLDLDGTQVRDIRICYGGMAATPKRASQCEQTLVGGSWTREAVQRAMAALDEAYRPIDDMRASSRYRGLVARNLLLRFYLESVNDQAETQVLQYGR
jgi:xanthine dehydrogenase small subunit